MLNNDMSRLKHCILYTIFILFIITCFLYYSIEDAYRERDLRETGTNRHLLCVIIPYRDRLNEIRRMVPHIGRFLEQQNIVYKILVVNQTDEYRFNRASLINIGWIESNQTRCDYMCMHDVDLLPLNSNISYRYPGRGVVRHISAGKYHPIKRYDYPKFIGGILMLTMVDFLAVNGMSNKYWGWGLEDDEFYLRLKEANLTNSIDRPENLTTGRNETFEHIHDPLRKRDIRVIGDQRKMSRRRDRFGGLNSIVYSIESRSLIRFEHYEATVLHIFVLPETQEVPNLNEDLFGSS